MDRYVNEFPPMCFAKEGGSLLPGRLKFESFDVKSDEFTAVCVLDFNHQVRAEKKFIVFSVEGIATTVDIASYLKLGAGTEVIVGNEYKMAVGEFYSSFSSTMYPVSGEEPFFKVFGNHPKEFSDLMKESMSIMLSPVKKIKVVYSGNNYEKKPGDYRGWLNASFGDLDSDMVFRLLFRYKDNDFIDTGHFIMAEGVRAISTPAKTGWVVNEASSPTETEEILYVKDNFPLFPDKDWVRKSDGSGGGYAKDSNRPYDQLFMGCVEVLAKGLRNKLGVRAVTFDRNLTVALGNYIDVEDRAGDRRYGFRINRTKILVKPDESVDSVVMAEAVDKITASESSKRVKGFEFADKKDKSKTFLYQLAPKSSSVVLP